MCPTPVGRIHTRVATIVLPALLGVVTSLVANNIAWLVLIGVYLLEGVALDAGVYSWLIRYQPPWLTGVLGLAELGILLVLANVLQLGLDVGAAIIFYAVAWTLAVWTKVVFLPIASLTYLESSFEFRRTEWSIPPSQASVPVLASAAEAEAGPGPVLSQASGVHAPRLERQPSPSRIIQPGDAREGEPRR
jgi:hypothetical protein